MTDEGTAAETTASDATEPVTAGPGSPEPPLPYADRPVATAPGHWVLARAGKRVLRPGGAALSAAMLEHAHLVGADVVELAPGLGRTAAEVIAADPASYIAIDRDPDAARRVAAVVGDRGRVRRGEAANTGLPDASADVVIGEAMLTMQGDKAKATIAAEAARVLRPGGRYAIHELGVVPDDIDEARYTELRKDLARAIHVNARPMTAAAWRQLLQEAGLVVDWVDTAPMALMKLGRNLRDEGLGGFARIARNVIADRELRQRMLTMRRTFKRYEQDMVGIALVAHKPA
ncbi:MULTISPECIES: class I SAM-dependent methyltransferase [unclassified Actinomyces]|uniref:class I SAM-dependent methyltransferase n=1 Tax=unclassified Actinomyces TaxID=2609248 RepID=UPI000D590441|nr:MULTISPECIES: class I SAM-dependent methyltransferase [unclassified Actinomyces]RAX19453.1 class I SAM-dependent methyltransferase [Actinomyces sp. Z5]RAX23237.1 class I SAM-dependent methyltransferase [Actinomyces sp. Z3]